MYSKEQRLISSHLRELTNLCILLGSNQWNIKPTAQIKLYTPYFVVFTNVYTLELLLAYQLSFLFI